MGTLEKPFVMRSFVGDPGLDPAVFAHHGTGKTARVIVFAVGEKAAEAEAAAYGKQWDDNSDTAWYAASSTEQVWYDDANAIQINDGNIVNFDN